MLAAGLLAKKAVEKGLTTQAVGEDEPRARLEGRHRLPRARRPDAVPRAARLPPRRLRLHDVHRQLRPAARGDLARRSTTASLVVASRALGQPQLRGPRSTRGARQLPRVAAARRRLRARRARGHRPDDRAARAGHGRRAVFLRDIWPTPAEVEDAITASVDARDVPQRVRRRLRRATTNWRALRRARGRPLRVGRRVDLRAAARRTSTA